eukprot:15254-Amphidinium_carterae.1
MDSGAQATHTDALELEDRPARDHAYCDHIKHNLQNNPQYYRSDWNSVDIIEIDFLIRPQMIDEGALAD